MASNQPGFYEYVQDNGHHDVWKIVVMFFVLVVIVVLGWFFRGIFGGSSEQVTPMVDQSVDPAMAVKRALLQTQNPPANLGAADAAARQKILSTPNPPAKLTEKQLQVRQTLIENI